MRKIVVLSFVTLDGVMQAPAVRREDTNGGFRYGGWVIMPHFDEQLGTIMDERLARPCDLSPPEAKTYGIFAACWPAHGELVAGHQCCDEVCQCSSRRTGVALG